MVGRSLLATLILASMGVMGSPQAPAAAAADNVPLAPGDRYEGASVVLVADLNSDGHADILAGDEVWLNDGSGGFSPSGIHAGGELAEDLDGDGHADLIGIGPADSVSVWIGRGDGNFEGPVRYSTGAVAVGAAAGDLNGDGRPDLAVATAESSVVVLLNAERGFEPPLAYSSVPLTRFRSPVAIADLDGDGHRDVVVADNSVAVHLNQGSGTLQDGIAYPTMFWTLSLVAADFDGDGWTDLALSRGFGAHAEVLWNDGSGALPERAIFAVTGLGSYPSQLNVGDLSGDGRPDLAVMGASSYGSWLSLLVSRSGRGFDTGPTYYTGGLEGGTDPSSVLIANIDRRNGLDMIVSMRSPRYGLARFFVLRHLGGQAYGGAADYYLDGEMPRVQAVDFSGAGKHDLLLNQDGNAWLMRSDAHGVLSPREEFPAGLGAIALDLNLDGRTDLLTNSGDSLIVRLCGVDGLPGSPELHVVGSFLCAGDIDGDGSPDLVVRRADDSLAVLANDGNGEFGAARSTGVIGWPPCAAGDLDGDGLDDLILGVVGHASCHQNLVDSIAVLRNLGGSFARTNAYAIADCGSVSQVIPSDMNRDGRLDVVTLAPVDGGRGGVSVLLNEGAGMLGIATGYSMYGEGNVLLIADIRQDGFPDMMQATWPGASGEGYLWVAVNQGDGTFTPPYLTFPQTSKVWTEPYPGSLALGDFNGDGRPDLAVGFGRHWTPRGVLIYMNRVGADLPTPTLLSLIEAQYVAGRILLAWYGGDLSPSTVALERRIGAERWYPLAPLHRDGTGHYTYEDAAVRPGSRHAYRLRLGSSAARVFSEAIEIDVPLARLALKHVAPNPSSGSMRIAFSLASQGPASIELWDVGVRRVHTVSVAPPMTGDGTYELADPAIEPGVYWIRLVQGTESAARKVLVMR